MHKPNLKVIQYRKATIAQTCHVLPVDHHFGRRIATALVVVGVVEVPNVGIGVLVTALVVGVVATFNSARSTTGIISVAVGKFFFFFFFHFRMKYPKGSTSYHRLYPHTPTHHPHTRTSRLRRYVLRILICYMCNVCVRVVPDKHFACEGQATTIVCPIGQVIQINSALYGHQGTAPHCNPEAPPADCGTSGADVAHATEVVRDECEGERACFLPATNEKFGDVCNGVAKYLEVDYSCGELLAFFFVDPFFCYHIVGSFE